jgi:hypothetical protein
MSVIVTFIVFSIFFLLIPQNAYAWGPATHIYFGVEVLKDLSVLSPVIASILTKFPYDFLYGCISADITVGKKYIDYHNHCHNWRIGFKILAEAETTAQKAFSFGYLSHLAADTVAHNFFVPTQMINAFSQKSTGHTYWEIRADSLIGREYWHEVAKISKEIQRDHDKLIRNVVEPTLFPFDLNKGIFNSILMINRLKQWRRMVRRIASRSRWDLGNNDVEKFHRLSSLTILDLLISLDHAECMRLDPTGRTNIKSAIQIRKSLKRLARRQVLSESNYLTAVKQLPIQAPPFE